VKQSLAALVGLFLLCASTTATGQQQGSGESAGLAGEWGIAVGMGLLWIGPDLFKADLAPESCRWCDTDPYGAWSPLGIDRTAANLFRWEESNAPALASDILAFALLPAGLVGTTYAHRGEADKRFGEDLALMAQAVAAAGILNQAVKYTVGRRRPYAHADSPPFTSDPDQNLSFYSGHTSAAFAQVAALSTILFKERSPMAPWSLAIGVPLAAGVGWLRMSADKHYLTDVLTGALLGSLIGWGWVELRR